jgi:hypothetical protein
MKHLNVYTYLKLAVIYTVFFLLGCRSTGPTNPTRDARVKPSDVIQQDNKRVIRKGVRAARREMRRRKRNMRKTGSYSD